jgi:NAD(P)-dependent dehydrogenase (short-subunit alcohol dehydrogenase family)
MWALLVVLVLFALFFWKLLGTRPVDLTGKTVLITGVSWRNIGHACAREVVLRGASRCILTAYRAQGIQDVEKDLQALGRKFELVLLDECDLSSEIGAAAVFNATSERCPDLILLLHVASVSSSASGDDIVGQMAKLFEANVLSCVRLASHFVSDLIARRGRIVITSSTAGLVPLKNRFLGLKV